MAPKQLLFATMWGLGDKWGWDGAAMRREWPAVRGRTFRRLAETKKQEGLLTTASC